LVQSQENINKDIFDIMRKLHKPIRMCINCRVRSLQSELYRVQCKDGELKNFISESGRSLYICSGCIEDREQSVVKRFNKLCKQQKSNDGKISIKIKEFLFNVKQS